MVWSGQGHITGQQDRRPVGSAMSGKRKRPRGLSSGRNSSMFLCYVKGGSFVKPFFGFESTPSGQSERRWLPDVALVTAGFRWVACLDSLRNPLRPAGRSRKILILSRNFQRGDWGGFQVDSPVKRPDAGKLPRSAPPYTDRAREEPWEGGGAPGAERSVRLRPRKVQRRFI